MKRILVADIMTREPITIKPNTTLDECIKKMVRYKVGSFPIVDKKMLIGFISQYDILWVIHKKTKKALKEIKAIEISRRKIITIRPVATVKEAFEKMKKFKLKKLPVTQGGEFVGLLTLRDILNFTPEFYPELEELSRIREETQKLNRLKNLQKQVNEGICEECGNRDYLHRLNGMLVCESCVNS